MCFLFHNTPKSVISLIFYYWFAFFYLNISFNSSLFEFISLFELFHCLKLDDIITKIDFCFTWGEIIFYQLRLFWIICSPWWFLNFPRLIVWLPIPSIFIPVNWLLAIAAFLLIKSRSHFILIYYYCSYSRLRTNIVERGFGVLG